MLLHLLTLLAASGLLLFGWAFYHSVLGPRRNPLNNLPGPPVKGFWGTHLGMFLDPARSPRTHEMIVKTYGRNIRMIGVGPWDVRLFSLDPVSMSHVLKQSTVYEKPWQSRVLITNLIGCGMLAAEGALHKRQRRVATPAFGLQNMRALVPVVFRKGAELRDRLAALIVDDAPLRVDAAMWISRATFDVIGLAGFDYAFDAIRDESNELFAAYKEMFEVAVSQSQGMRSLLSIYLPIIDRVFPNRAAKTVRRCQAVIQRVAGQLIQEKKRKMLEAEKSGAAYEGRDLLSLLLKSNTAADLPPSARLSDADILHNINTFMFAGSDTTSLALTWTLLLLAMHAPLQARLRVELRTLGAGDARLTALTEDELQSLQAAIAELPFLDNICKESLRLVPPVHSSLRVATRDDVLPTSGGGSISVPKGAFVHVPVEGFNLDKEMWGPDAWEFNPDRWDHLPETVEALPGLYEHMLTFSAGPRSCIGMRFSMIEMKTFLYILLTNFVFRPTDEKVIKVNVVLTRPYVSRRFLEGSQCPILISPYVEGEDASC